MSTSAKNNGHTRSGKSDPAKGSTEKNRKRRGRGHEETHLVLALFHGNGKPVDGQLVRVEKFRAHGRYFEILLLKNEKKKKLMLYPAEVIDTVRTPLWDQYIEVKVKNPGLIPEEISGYKELLALVKSSLRNYAHSTTGNLKRFLWSQFGASIEMLMSAIRCWPDDAWGTDKRFFYTAYHALIFLDYYLTEPSTKFKAPLSFSITEKDFAPPEALDDVIPDRIYTKQEMLEYGKKLKEKCRAVISSMNKDRFLGRWIEKNGDMNYAWLEILLYNMRHVQHHAAQLNMLLRQKVNNAPGWVPMETTPL